MNNDERDIERARVVVERLKYPNGTLKHQLSVASGKLFEKFKNALEGIGFAISPQSKPYHIIMNFGSFHLGLSETDDGHPGLSVLNAPAEPIAGLRYNPTKAEWEGEELDPDTVPIPGKEPPRIPAVVVVAEAVVRKYEEKKRESS